MIRLDSSEAELDALQQVCERLAGFHERITLEWLDGALCAVMAGPSVPAGPEAVLEPLLDDSWARTFADPDDAAQALAALRARWRVLRSQLDPDALIDEIRSIVGDLPVLDAGAPPPNPDPTTPAPAPAPAP